MNYIKLRIFSDTFYSKSKNVFVLSVQPVTKYFPDVSCILPQRMNVFMAPFFLPCSLVLHYIPTLAGHRASITNPH